MGKGSWNLKFISGRGGKLEGQGNGHFMAQEIGQRQIMVAFAHSTWLSNSCAIVSSRVFDKRT